MPYAASSWVLGSCRLLVGLSRENFSSFLLEFVAGGTAYVKAVRGYAHRSLKCVWNECHPPNHRFKRCGVSRLAVLHHHRRNRLQRISLQPVVDEDERLLALLPGASQQRLPGFPRFRVHFLGWDRASQIALIQ